RPLPRSALRQAHGGRPGTYPSTSRTLHATAHEATKMRISPRPTGPSRAGRLGGGRAYHNRGTSGGRTDAIHGRRRGGGSSAPTPVSRRVDVDGRLVRRLAAAPPRMASPRRSEGSSSGPTPSSEPGRKP